MQTAHAIDIGVQTADAERPSFEYRNNDVRLTFTDWKEEVVSLIFHDVLAVSWQDAESSGPQDRDDCAFEIKNSDWMALHTTQGLLEAGIDYRHLRLCFNGLGVFDILCGSFQKP